MPPLVGNIDLRNLPDVSSWLPLLKDHRRDISLYNIFTGAVRSEPWIALREPDLAVYFANIKTGVTRWFPPPRWMEDWVSRPNYLHDNLIFEALSKIGKQMLPIMVARERVEGGAPYLDAQYPAKPQYEYDYRDTPDTYPLGPTDFRVQHGHGGMATRP